MPASRLRPRKTPVQPRAVETRDRILAAAARVFSRHGYAAGTTNRIAAEAGLSVGSLYQYFPNKDAVLVALVRRHASAGADAVASAVDAARRLPPDDVPGRVGLVVDAFVAVHADDPGLHQVLFEQAPRPPELLAELHALEDTAVAVATDLLGDGLTGSAADPPVAARIVVTTVESLVHRLVATRDPTMPLDEVRRQVTAMVVRYLAPGPPGPDQSRRSSNRSVEK